MGLSRAICFPRAHYDLNKSFEHVQNDLIARGAQYELSAIARDNGVFS